jgi:hypothetical protein
VAPRSTEQRKADTLRLLAETDDCWVSTASSDGTPYLVPLSFVWDGETLTIATAANSRTVANARAGGMRVGLGGTRDVVMIDGELAITPIADDRSRADAFVAATGWDPRDEEGAWVLLVLRPSRIQVWREADELAGRTIMRAGSWVA